MKRYIVRTADEVRFVYPGLEGVHLFDLFDDTRPEGLARLLLERHEYPERDRTFMLTEGQIVEALEKYPDAVRHPVLMQYLDDLRAGRIKAPVGRKPRGYSDTRRLSLAFNIYDAMLEEFRDRKRAGTLSATLREWGLPPMAPHEVAAEFVRRNFLPEIATAQGFANLRSAYKRAKRKVIFVKE